METMNEQAQSPLSDSPQPLESLKIKELRKRYREVFGVPTSSSNQSLLIRRITAKLENHEDEDNALHVIEFPADPTEPVNPEMPEEHGVGESSEGPDQPAENPVSQGDGGFAEIVDPIADEASEPAGLSTSESTDVADLPLEKPRDPRLPHPGTILTKKYKDSEYQVTVLENTFEFEGEAYTSLSTIAKRIAGCCWNGFTFFGLNKRAAPVPEPAQPEIRAEGQPGFEIEEPPPEF
jgi:hypothetical protein